MSKWFSLDFTLALWHQDVMRFKEALECRVKNLYMMDTWRNIAREDKDVVLVGLLLVKVRSIQEEAGTVCFLIQNKVAP